MLSNDKIVEIMSLPLASERVGYYREIFKLSTGKDFSGCLCGNGAQRLYKACKAYAEAIKNNENK